MSIKVLRFTEITPILSIQLSYGEYAQFKATNELPENCAWVVKKYIDPLTDSGKFLCCHNESHTGKTLIFIPS